MQKSNYDKTKIKLKVFSQAIYGKIANESKKVPERKIGAREDFFRNYYQKNGMGEDESIRVFREKYSSFSVDAIKKWIKDEKTNPISRHIKNEESPKKQVEEDEEER